LLAEKILAVAASCRESPEKFTSGQHLINLKFQKNLKVLLFWRWQAMANCVLKRTPFSVYLKKAIQRLVAAILHNV
jgi:hypothetical protein